MAYVTGAYAIIYFLNIGFSFFQISLLLTIYSLATILTDIPTGAIADIFGRKMSVVLSFLISGILTLFIPFFSNFYILALLFFLRGVALTLMTGADEAWVISNLQNEKKGHLVNNFYAHKNSIMNAGYVISPLIGAFVIANSSMSLLWVLQGTGLLIAAAILLLAKEKLAKQKVQIKASFQKTYEQSKNAIQYGIRHPILFKTLIAFFFLTFIFGAFPLLWQAYLKEFNVPLPVFGYVASIASFLSIFAPIVSLKLSKRFHKTSRYIAGTIFVYALILAGSYFATFAFMAILIIIMAAAGLDFLMPIEAPFFQRFVPNKMRASVGSFKSTINSLGTGIAALLAGAAADFIGVKPIMALLSLVFLPPVFLYLRISKKHNH